jgi:hypothetical protein
MRHAILAAALLATPALAEERPNILPTRDVAVTYRIEGGGPSAPSSLGMAWHAVSRSMRMDVPGMGWMVANHDTNRAFMAMEGARMVMDLPMAEAMRQYGQARARASSGRARTASPGCPAPSGATRTGAGRAAPA